MGSAMVQAGVQTAPMPATKSQKWLPRWGRSTAAPPSSRTANAAVVHAPDVHAVGGECHAPAHVAAQEEEAFVPEDEEPAAEWRNGQTQGDHLMFAKANRQSRASNASRISDDDWANQEY